MSVGCPAPGVSSQKRSHALRPQIRAAPPASNRLHAPFSCKLPVVAPCCTPLRCPQPGQPSRSTGNQSLSPVATQGCAESPARGCPEGPARRRGRPCAQPRAPPRRVALPRDPERAAPLAAAARARGAARGHFAPRLRALCGRCLVSTAILAALTLRRSAPGCSLSFLRRSPSSGDAQMTKMKDGGFLVGIPAVCGFVVQRLSREACLSST